MEQEPIPGQVPLEPPDARVARAYLDVLPDVERRAERALDLRRLAQLYVVEGIVTAVYIGIYVLAWGLQRQQEGPPTTPLNLLAVFVIWSFLARSVRERYGARRLLGGPVRAGYYALVFAGVAFVVVLLLIHAFTGKFSWFWAPVPSLLVLAGGLWVGSALRKDAGNQPLRVAPKHLPFTRKARIGTAVLGTCLAVSVAASGTAGLTGWGRAVSSFSMCAVMIVWLIAQLSGVASDLGEIWRTPQWCLFAFGALATAAMVLLTSVRADLAPPVGAALAAVVLIVSVIVSLGPERDDD